ncbi:MAG: hypothetical protein EKK55_12240 [Rhodocyclaceae bacterium]|nr:MAG: hypothetical protein EKK55_12240 [Rhodocyclaceae bacterium]
MLIHIDHEDGELARHVDDAVDVLRKAARHDAQPVVTDPEQVAMLEAASVIIARRGQEIFDGVVTIGEAAEARREQATRR